MKQVIASRLLPTDIKEALYREGFCCIPAGKSTAGNDETACHPDMLYFKLSDGTLLVSNNINSTVNLYGVCPYKISETTQKPCYPEDCALNCFYARNCLISGKYTAAEILADCVRSGGKRVIVRQGYAKCSVVEVAPDAYISGDAGIAEALRAVGCEVLEVTNSGIELKGFSNGFIGGCALADAGRVYFTGNLKLHPDCLRMENFCHAHGAEPVGLSESALYDYGGFIRLG